MQAFLYILFSQTLNKYYVGSTTDLKRRLDEHNRGKEKFTKMGISCLLVYSEIFEELKYAWQRERYIKKIESEIFIRKLISSA